MENLNLIIEEFLEETALGETLKLRSLQLSRRIRSSMRKALNEQKTINMQAISSNQRPNK